MNTKTEEAVQDTSSQACDIAKLLKEIDGYCSDTPKKSRAKFERCKVEREVFCDTGRLYGSLDGAIAYLNEVKKEYPTATLDEHWTGYEDMEMRFVYEETETDEEYLYRLNYAAYVQKSARENRDREARNKEILAKIEVLKKQL